MMVVFTPLSQYSWGKKNFFKKGSTVCVNMCNSPLYHVIHVKAYIPQQPHVNKSLNIESNPEDLMVNLKEGRCCAISDDLESRQIPFSPPFYGNGPINNASIFLFIKKKTAVFLRVTSRILSHFKSPMSRGQGSGWGVGSLSLCTRDPSSSSCCCWAHSRSSSLRRSRDSSL